jgi:CubicO group peptidase (beta-lactamase class C family)
MPPGLATEPPGPPAMAPRLRAVAAVLEAGLAEGVAPSLAAAVVRGGELVHLSAHGAAPAEAGALEPGRLEPSHPFDVASLTKVLCTATLCAQAVAEGALELDAPAARWWPGFEAAGKGAVTVRQLLAHSSGLPAWRPWFRLAAGDPVARPVLAPAAARGPLAGLAPALRRSRALVLRALLAEPLEAPPGTRAIYSDPGFVALGQVVEAALGAPLPALFAARVAAPLGLSGSFFVDGLSSDAAALERRARGCLPGGPSEARREISRGTVDDDVAWALGGAAGHAGLFATAADVAAVGSAWLEALAGRGLLVDPTVAALFARRDGTFGSSRALGWDTPSGPTTSLGNRLGRGPLGALGHLGFTGCSLWLDLDERLAVALLTNHVHPRGVDRARILAYRRRFHDAVGEASGVA